MLGGFVVYACFVLIVMVILLVVVVAFGHEVFTSVFACCLL